MGKKPRKSNGPKTRFEQFAESVIGKEAPLSKKARIVKGWPDELEMRTTPEAALKKLWNRQEVKNKSGAKNLSVVTGSATRIPLSSSSQDKLLLMGSNLELTIHWKPFLGESHRVLKKTGESRLVFAGLLKNRHEIPEIVESLQQNGFMVESIVKFAELTKRLEALLFVARPGLR